MAFENTFSSLETIFFCTIHPLGGKLRLDTCATFKNTSVLLSMPYFFYDSYEMRNYFVPEETGGEGGGLCCSLANQNNFTSILQESCSKPVPIMLCGNKTDLRQQNIAEGKTVISSESGKKLAKVRPITMILTEIISVCAKTNEACKATDGHGVTLRAMLQTVDAASRVT